MTVARLTISFGASESQITEALLTVGRPLLAAGDDSVDLRALRSLLAECADSRICDERSVQRVDGPLRRRASVRGDAVERGRDAGNAVRSHDAGAVLPPAAFAGVEHEAGRHLLVRATVEQDGFSAAAFFGGRSEQDDPSGELELFEGTGGRDGTGAACDSDQVVSARVAHALQSVHFAVEADRRGVIVLRGGGFEDGRPRRRQVVRVTGDFESVLLLHVVGQDLVCMVLVPAEFRVAVCSRGFKQARSALHPRRGWVGLQVLTDRVGELAEVVLDIADVLLDGVVEL
jgi:hypothetical protein